MHYRRKILNIDMQNQQINKKTPLAKAPSLIKLGACFIYDTLVVVALCFACAYIYILLAGDATQGLKRVLLQLFLWLCIGMYFVRCWSKSGQTVAMKTWHLQLTQQSGALLTLKMATIRYMLATISLMAFGLGFFWSIVDREALFLHDRILKCRIKFESK